MRHSFRHSAEVFPAPRFSSILPQKEEPIMKTVMKRISQKSLRMISLIMILFSGVAAEAYIPSAQTISNRVARGHGRGAYAVEQEVHFRTAAEPIVLRERWTVINGETMRLSVSSLKSSADSTSGGVSFEAVYRAGKRALADSSGQPKTTNMSLEFTEPFIHARSGKGFLSLLVRSRIVAPSILQEPPRITKVELARPQPDPHIWLGRTAGVVTWVFGEPTPPQAPKTNPAAWIEQDAFVLRRLRFPTDAEFSADQYSNFAGSIRLPRERTLNWGDNSVFIRITAVRAIKEDQAAKLVDSRSLASAKSPRLPDIAQIREFYSRFR